MEFSATEDVRAPAETAFACLSDIDLIEGLARRRGIEVRRMTEDARPAAGMVWQANLRFRGRVRVAEITLLDHEAPRRMVFAGRTGGLETRFMLDVAALSPRVTRLSAVAQLRATTLSARLSLQSMALAKAGLSRRYRVRMAQFAREVEERAARLG